MLKFLIQTYDGDVTDDFSYHLIQAIKYQNWYNRKTVMSYRITDSALFPKYIPIGSVEFVESYLEKYFEKTVKPMNIPQELMHDKFLGRNVYFESGEVEIVGEKFVKSNSKIKKYTDFVKDIKLPNDSYMISDIIDIFSEWRGFVYKGKLVGLQWYSGDFKKFPEVFKIEEMVHEFKEAPIAYTIDVGVTIDGTFLIECHDFFSCGLYGFADYKILPQMFSNWFFDFVKA